MAMQINAVTGGLRSISQARPNQNQTTPAAQQAPQITGPDQSPAQPELQSTLDSINDQVQNLQRSIQFSISETTGRTIIKVYDAQTEELIREIPPEALQRIGEMLEKQLEDGARMDDGLLLDTMI